MLKIGAVSYLNTKPLIRSLADRLAGRAELRLDLPSRLADGLKRGDLDVALIPTVEYLRGRGSGFETISNAVIGCRGPVISIAIS